MLMVQQPTVQLVNTVRPVLTHVSHVRRESTRHLPNSPAVRNVQQVQSVPQPQPQPVLLVNTGKYCLQYSTTSCHTFTVQYYFLSYFYSQYYFFYSLVLLLFIMLQYNTTSCHTVLLLFIQYYFFSYFCSFTV